MAVIEREAVERSVTESAGAILGWQLGRLTPMPASVPNDWELVRLTSVATLESGHTPSRRNPDYWDGGIPWISLHDSAGLDVPEIHSTAHTISSLGLDHSSARLLPKGTVVFSRTATVGKSTTMASEMATSQDFANYVCGKRLLNHYLVHLFRFMKPEWTRLMAGSTHNSIYMPVFQNLQILLPPFAEQEAIAKALNDADAHIESLKQLLEKKRLVKQGAMEELLSGKRRLPGLVAGSGYRATELGEIPNDWGVVALGSQLRRAPSYGINAAAIPFSSRYPTYIRITDIDDEGCFLELTKTSVKHVASSEYLLEPGDVVLARTGASVGKSYLYDVRDGPLVFAGFLIRISPDPLRLGPAFFAYLTQSRFFRHWVTVNSMRSGQPGINSQEYAALPIPLPPTKAEQDAIVASLSGMDAQIWEIKKRIAKARDLKQGMMQELLTGRIRLV